MKNLNSSEIAELISTFRHKFKGRVRFDEVDMIGVVHNIKYLYWLEWARTEYLNDTGFTKNPANYILLNPLMTVHNEIDYFKPIRFNEGYFVYSRISTIKNSSLMFENIVTDEQGELLARGRSVLVNINPKTGESIRINDEIRELIQNYEISEVEIAE